jgi:hypothetical protein
MWICLQVNLNKIIECCGGNDYDIPHLGKENMERLRLLWLVLEVTPVAMELLENIEEPEFILEEKMFATESAGHALGDFLLDDDKMPVITLQIRRVEQGLGIVIVVG